MQNMVVLQKFALAGGCRLPSQFCSCLKQKLQFQLCCLRQMPLDAQMVVSSLKSSSLPIQEASLFCSLCWVHFSSSLEACCDLNEHTLDFFHSFVLSGSQLSLQIFYNSSSQIFSNSLSLSTTPIHKTVTVTDSASSSFYVSPFVFSLLPGSWVLIWTSFSDFKEKF